MISEKDKKEIEKWLLKCENPKTKQKIQLLISNEKFLDDIDILKKKWNDFLKDYVISIEKIEEILDKIMQKVYQAHVGQRPPPKLTKQELENLSIWGKIFKEDLFINTKFNKDIFNLCQKYKLYPIDLWKYPLFFYILTGNFEQPNIWAGLKLLGILSTRELIDLPKNMNFDLEVRKNKKTKEQELFVQIFESTSWRDLKKHWKIINDLQKELKKEKGIDKRYYPKKNLEIEKKIIKLDKSKYKKYYEPTSNEWINQKITDQKKAFEIYDDSLFDEEDEQKAKNRIKQIRHRHKKM